ncbi:3-deoxy-manno-octulosonate cytidylyltransferase [Bathymodiolus platifrons methanotrophic gill symbiont]|uniref:3-deoxy-manno-octulosonate cytidylyltransferase n=1 Tax=Bathymodiolus platifrons methanotrophic gill symbiont TaxID=113268 RepID=UPI000B41D7D9|nr:3-deoxy-manno-octulosonate cytidylyltransferase [Bathymodiolus platifrons methanotrophic gill symbiont]MCK5869546.1 3-deoxy-manno-octulosonate cytidylyltransferase [Methyloprofundus sp.]TXK98568.1 3-deoxy-manno-octulosonate cytidylyltransferase [Methylococcaceae bacterium CS4]TXL00543.1 3-deoxy-manno-octulosonate cytidylyltransferase [Methylococcaceae bacterium CS5]TXL01582.1 3-deoxy-manno-octulosonate cytidylyltransferase [Methylococcaceae bacterium HT1]TXL05062.1 3-deoxy-manno-octulosonat
MSCAFKVVIPARYGSSRLPGKPLLNIAGKPMILHVCDRAKEAGAAQIVVATDDIRILDAVKNYGFDAVMTSPSHESGTERLAEVAEIYQWEKEDIIVNLQGDEPLIPAAYIALVANSLAQQTVAGIATLAAEIVLADEVFNPNAVKVVVDKLNYALYFSRAAIPWDREEFQQIDKVAIKKNTYLRHIGMYAYRVSFLQHYVQWETSVLEKIEMLEQLRILWQGEKILVAKVDKAPEAGVDTQEDLLRVEQRMSS